MKLEACFTALEHYAPRVHCLTNYVSMQDIANLLLAVGGSAIMATEVTEVEEITAISQATLLNTGTPDATRFAACALAGAKANKLGHPVVLDPVGAGASQFRQKQLHTLLQAVKPTLIRCNLEEAVTLLTLRSAAPACDGLSDGPIITASDAKGHITDEIVRAHKSGGVESGISGSHSERTAIAKQLSNTYHCTVLLSGKEDIITDGSTSFLVSGGDCRIASITGSGCMLSALCAALLGAGIVPHTAALAASVAWKAAAAYAGKAAATSTHKSLGSFHCLLFDAVSELPTLTLKEEICIENLTQTA